jgi:hypothetical protein
MQMRNKEERQTAIKPVLKKLSELHLDPISYESIKILYTKLKDYIQLEERIELNIPFNEYNCTIKGVLSLDKREQVWVKLDTNIE